MCCIHHHRSTYVTVACMTMMELVQHSRQRLQQAAHDPAKHSSNTSVELSRGQRRAQAPTACTRVLSDGLGDDLHRLRKRRDCVLFEARHLGPECRQLPRDLDLCCAASGQCPGVSAYQLQRAAGLSGLHTDEALTYCQRNAPRPAACSWSVHTGMRQHVHII